MVELPAGRAGLANLTAKVGEVVFQFTSPREAEIHPNRRLHVRRLELPEVGIVDQSDRPLA